MIKLILSALWICIITLVSSYVAASWKTQTAMVGDEGGLTGLNYTKTTPINVPIIAEGDITGYVVAQFVYTADAAALKQLSVPPDAFILDEAFRTIFSDERIDIDNIERFDLASLTANLATAVNTRFGADIVQDVLVEQFTFVTKEEVRAQAGVSAPIPVVTADEALAKPEGEEEESSGQSEAPAH